jgi:hypothetical protein
MANRSKRGAASRRISPALILIAVGALAIVVAAAFALTGRTGGASGGTPQVAVDRESINLGDVPVGQTVSAAFTITNTGSEPLRLTEPPYIEVKEGC